MGRFQVIVMIDTRAIEDLRKYIQESDEISEEDTEVLLAFSDNFTF